AGGRRRFRDRRPGRASGGDAGAGRRDARQHTAERQRAVAAAARNPDDAPRSPGLQGKDRRAGRSARAQPLLDRRRRGALGRSGRHRHGRGARRVRLADTAAPRPDEPPRSGAAWRMAGRSQCPVPERDRPRASPRAHGRAEEEATERVVERTRDAYETARARMVEEQLVQRGVTDDRVLSAMRRVPSHLFVEGPLRDRAHGDHPLPIGEEQTISQPYIVGLMSRLLELRGQEKVLEVGTGSGYQTAVLAELARRVCSIERLPRLAERARALLEQLGYDNVWVRVGSGTLGWPDEAPFDRILVTAGGPSIPPPLFQQLGEGGRMVVPVGDVANQTLTVVEKVRGEMKTRLCGECKFVKLVGKYAWET